MKNSVSAYRRAIPVLLRHSRQWLLLMLLGVAVTTGGCAAKRSKITPRDMANLAVEDKILLRKYRKIREGLLYLSATGETKHNVTMFDQNDVLWQSILQLGEGSDRHSTYTDVMHVPRTLHVTWRTEDAGFWKNSHGSRETTADYEGERILGDYTVPLSTRIPDDVLHYIRANGGTLRIKIRLADHGVLVAWDVEEWRTMQCGKEACYKIRYAIPGGDFREAQIENGKVVERGWMIMPDGSKMETDY